MVWRRTNGFHPINQLRDEMDRLVNDFFGPVTTAAPAGGAVATRGFPPINVWEEGDSLFAEAEVPGLKSDQIEVSVVGSDLTIRGQRGETNRAGAAYHRQERGTGEFNRLLRLPIEVDANKVEASLKDGILLVRMPKAESAKPRKIKVEPGNRVREARFDSLRHT